DLHSIHVELATRGWWRLLVLLRSERVRDASCRPLFAFGGDLLVALAVRKAVEVGVRKIAGGRSGEVDDVEEPLAVVGAQARSAADDLLELGQGVHDSG